MQRRFKVEELNTLSKVKYAIGTAETIEQMITAPVKQPFDKGIMDFLNFVSRILMNSKEAKVYPDVVALGFWLRRANLNQLRERYRFPDGYIHLGKGIVFHIAPSNVPVNFAYSLFSGFLAGNCNIVRIPSKDFPQVKIIIDSINAALEKYDEYKSYISLIQYAHDKEINDVLSSICDLRIIWGGDSTIGQIRKSKLPPRSVEITFADRYSLALIDSDYYMEIEDKKRTASNFYNDTYLLDQNACTSPRLVVWAGRQKKEAKEIFWKELHELVKYKYKFQDIMAVNKLTSAYFEAANDKIYIESNVDNLIVRVSIKEISTNLFESRENSGFFYEYDIDDVSDLIPLLSDSRVQTVGIIGDTKDLRSMLLKGLKGVDRIVTVGNTLDFDLVWDGYDLVRQMSRIVGGIYE